MSDFKLPDRLFGLPVIVYPNMPRLSEGAIILGKPFSGEIPLNDDEGDKEASISITEWIAKKNGIEGDD